MFADVVRVCVDILLDLVNEKLEEWRSLIKSNDAPVRECAAFRESSWALCVTQAADSVKRVAIPAVAVDIECEPANGGAGPLEHVALSLTRPALGVLLSGLRTVQEELAQATLVTHQPKDQ